MTFNGTNNFNYSIITDYVKPEFYTAKIKLTGFLNGLSSSYNQSYFDFEDDTNTTMIINQTANNNIAIVPCDQCISGSTNMARERGQIDFSLLNFSYTFWDHVNITFYLFRNSTGITSYIGVVGEKTGVIADNDAVGRIYIDSGSNNLFAHLGSVLTTSQGWNKIGIFVNYTNGTLIYFVNDSQVVTTGILTASTNASYLVIRGNNPNTWWSIDNVTINGDLRYNFNYPINVTVEMNETHTEFNNNSVFNGAHTINLNQTFLNEYYFNNTNLTYNFKSINDGILEACILDYSYNKTYNIFIIDERNNSGFEVSNLTSVKLYFDDNSSYYDFKAANDYRYNITLDQDYKMRLELEYKTGDIVIRYIDTGLIDNDTIRICANTEGITHYEIIPLSSQIKGVFINSKYADCRIVSDYTRFAYQDAYIVKAYTINNQYDLYTLNADGSLRFLSSIDGSIATYINLDSLEFNLRDTSYLIEGESLTFEKDTENSRVIIRYLNVYNNSKLTRLDIVRLDTSTTVYSDSTSVSPDNAIFYFDYSGLTNITNTTVFRATITRIDQADQEHTMRRYFDINARSGVIPAEVAAVLSIILLVFGLTLASTRYTIGWLGIVLTIGSMGILAFSNPAWYITFLFAITGTVLLYIIVLMFRSKSYSIT